MRDTRVQYLHLLCPHHSRIAVVNRPPIKISRRRRRIPEKIAEKVNKRLSEFWFLLLEVAIKST